MQTVKKKPGLKSTGSDARRSHIDLCILLLFTAAINIAVPASAIAGAKISSDEYKAGDRVSIQGRIEPGKDLYIAIAQSKMFAPVDTSGTHEVKRLEKDGRIKNFNQDTKIPPLYYMLTTDPGAFGKQGKKRFGGPSVLLGKDKGIYSTTMYYLKNQFSDVDVEAISMLGPIKSEQQWNFLRYANETGYGISTIVKECTIVGKVTIFSRTVITDQASGNYWDKDTSIKLDKSTGLFTASFKTFRHTPPDTAFDVYINGVKNGSYNVVKNGFWLSKGYRYMNPIWIVIGAILVGAYFSMIGAAGGMLMAAFQILIVHTAGPVGINAANVLKPSNMALTLFSPLGSCYRYAIVERRVAWPVGISFGLGIFIGAIWLGKYVSAYLSMNAYKEWLAILVLLMGIQTIREMMPKAMQKRKNIRAMVNKFDQAVARARADGSSVEMGKIEAVKTGIMDYRFKFWGEQFTINPLLFALLGLAIGVVSRSFGIGGGFLLVPAMTTLGALPMYVAVPISLIGTCFSSVGAFIGYLMTGYFPDMVLIIAIIVGGFVGGMLGSRMQKLFSEKILKIVLAFTLFFLFFRFFKIEIWI